MSRCFPYPPPGFGKKARTDHSDLLAKEKQKEREHKKEKRDKEKKEGKEKKDKHKSRDKHKEKKDQKERHKDRKWDKDKNRTPDDKRIEGQTGGRNEQKVGSMFSEELGKRNKDENGAANRVLQFTGGISRAEEVDDSRFTEELGRRMDVEKKATASRMLENITGSIPERVESLGTSTTPGRERGNGKPVVANFVSNGKRKADEVSLPPPEKANHHHQALHSYQGLPNGKPMVANFSKEQRRADGVGHPVEKDNHKHRALSHRTPMVSNCISTEQRRVDEIAHAVETGSHNHQPLLQTPNGSLNHQQTPDHQALLQTPAEKNEVGSIEGKEKGKDRKAENGHGARRKDTEREEKKNEGKDKNRYEDKAEEEKEKKKKKKKKRVNDGHDTPKDSGRDQGDNIKFKPLAPYNNNETFAGNCGNSKKRKEIEMNGFLHEGEVPPNKLPRPASSSYLQNGKTLEFDHIHTTYPSSIRHGSQNNIKAERPVKNKEHTINVAQPPPSALEPSVAAVAQLSPAELKLSLAAVTQLSPADLKPPLVVAQPSAAALKPKLAADASRKSKVSKPPHADSKFLSQIYSLPKTQEWPEYDDQEWLFSSSDHPLKPKVESEPEEEPQVWAEGLNIGSADVFALPYVIPH